MLVSYYILILTYQFNVIKMDKELINRDTFGKNHSESTKKLYRIVVQNMLIFFQCLCQN